MQQLEPTYLRYVYDGLTKGSISPNNPTSLPIGFIGLFEQEFPSSMSLVERKALLTRLTLWALLKGPVSAEMVAEVLNEHPDDTKALIDSYSKWFNSPEPGKYIIYHDRLRTYFLQKLSDHEVQNLNETLISYLDNAIKSESLKEAEIYALEHLSTHMVIESQMGDNYKRLHENVNKEDLWKRQISTSNEYKWSQRAVQYAIKEGARRHHEMNTLRSTINSYKLKFHEENSISDIIRLLSNGNIELAFSRIKSFDSQKQGIIYILIINELIFENLKSINNKKELCKRVLEKIKSESKVIDMDVKFLSEITIYNYHIEFLRMGIDDSIIWLKTLSRGSSEYDNDGNQYLVVDLETLLDYDVDLKIVENLAFKLISNTNLLANVCFKIIKKYSINNNSEDGSYKVEIFRLTRKIITKIDNEFSNDNYTKILNQLVVNNDTNGNSHLIDEFIKIGFDRVLIDESIGFTENWQQDLIIKNGLLSFIQFGKIDKAIQLYKKIKTDNYKNLVIEAVPQLLFNRKAETELLTFLGSIKIETSQIKFILEICKILSGEGREDEVLELILFNNGVFKATFNNESSSILDYLIKLKKSSSIQQRFNLRSLYLKTFMILNRNDKNLKLRNESFDFHWLLEESIYLIRCRKDKQLMIGDLIDLLNEITILKSDSEINKLIKYIINEVESELSELEFTYKKNNIVTNYFFSLLGYDSATANKFLPKLVLYYNQYIERGIPQTVGHKEIWNKFYKGFDELCLNNISIAYKVILEKIYPKFNAFPGKCMESPLYLRFIKGLIEKGDIDRAMSLYNKTKKTFTNQEYSLENEKEHNTIYKYKYYEGGDTFLSSKKLNINRFSINETFSIIEKLKHKGNINEAVEMFDDLKKIYPNCDYNLYRKIIFNGIHEIDKNPKEAHSYLKNFILDISYHHFHPANKKNEDFNKIIQPKRKRLGKIDPSKINQIEIKFILSILNTNNTLNIFSTKNKSFFDNLYDVLLKNDKIHLAVKDVLNSNIFSPYYDYSKHQLDYLHTINYETTFFTIDMLDEKNKDYVFKCREEELTLNNGIYYFNDIPYTGTSYKFGNNYFLEIQTEFKDGLIDGLQRYYKDGIFNKAIGYMCGQIDENCFSKHKVLSSISRTPNSENNHKDFLSNLKNEIGTNKLYNEVKEILQRDDNGAGSLANELFEHIKLYKEIDSWRHFKGWEKLLKRLNNFDKSFLDNIITSELSSKGDSSILNIITNELDHYKITDSANNQLSKYTDTVNSADLVDEYVNYIANLVWISDILMLLSYKNKSLKALELSINNTEFILNLDLTSLAEQSYLDPLFDSLKILINRLYKYEKYESGFNLLKKISNIFFKIINEGHDYIEWNGIPAYGDGNHGLYHMFVNICRFLSLEGQKKEVENILGLINNLYWIEGIKREILFHQYHHDPKLKSNSAFDNKNIINDQKLLAEIEVIHSRVENDLKKPYYNCFSNFNLYVDYAEKLINKNEKQKASVYLKNAAEIKEKYNDQFQRSIREYNRMPDDDDDWYEKNRKFSYLPSIEKFYINRVYLENIDFVVEEIISAEKIHLIDEDSGKLFKREWKNARWRDNSCYDLISKMYFVNNEFKKSFNYALKINDAESRNEQLTSILDKLDLNTCIKYINLNPKKNEYSSFFSGYLSSKIVSEFNIKNFEFSYLSNYYGEINNLEKIIEYKILNNCLCSQKLDNEKLKLLNEIMEFDELANIQLDTINSLN
tara:strand:+ start:3722 stop:8890 length:5169 start_codon:yes stop_codon:yes gene_type:complete